MFAINTVRDLRNNAVCMLVDGKEFAKAHPLSSLASGGILPLGYLTAKWLERAVHWIASPFSSSSHKEGIALLATTHRANVPPSCSKWSWNPIHYLPLSLQPQFRLAFFKTTPFKGYEIDLPQNHPCKGAGLLSTSLRPINFLINAYFKDSPINVVQPGWSLFAFKAPQEKIRQFIDTKTATDPHEVTCFSAKGYSGTMDRKPIADFSEIYGTKSCAFFNQEIQEIVGSQEIHLSKYLPLPFYRGLKEAMAKDGIVLLPKCNLEKMRSLHCYLFLNKVGKDPLAYGFQSKEHFAEFKKLSLYSLGAMLIKSQHFHVLADGNGKIVNRKAGTKDRIELVDLCGLRDQHTSTLSPGEKRALMKETFRSALLACKEGLALFPAVGMGVWAGNPQIYWPALCEAIQETDVPLQWIGVNPGHAPTPFGQYYGSTGSEFEEILKGYIKAAKLRGDAKGLARLKKVYNLHSQKKDIVQLARSLKLQYPGWRVSLVNASDPDVTLGNHVGEYTNTMSRKCSTTEENYTALGTNAFCFEGITRIQQTADKIFQT